MHATVLVIAATGAIAVTLVSGRTARAALIHDYELNGTFADSLGGPPMVSAGGTLGPTGYTFAADQGPNLSNALSSSTYSIEMGFSIDDPSGYRKLIDFKDRTTDNGLYNLATALDFFPLTVGPVGAFAANVEVTLLVTRDGGTKQVAGYVNGVPQFSFTDSADDATFSAADNIAHFLRDDTGVVDQPPSGFLDFVRIYDTALPAPLCGNGVVDPGEECDDGNVPAGDCCFNCQLPTSCRAADKSLLLLERNATDDSKDKLTWKWLKGAETAPGELADPTATANYTLCLYAGTASARVALAAGPKWKAAGTKGYKFKDPSGTPDGALTAVVKSGAAGKAKALVKGKGANLPDNLAGVLSLPVTVKLVNDTNSTCFEAVYSSTIKNDGTHFKSATQWYLGDLGQSCDQVCASHGSTYSALTRTFAGDSGTDGDCLAVLNGLGVPGPLTYPSAACGVDAGCLVQNGNTFRCVTPATTSTGSYPDVQRACACE